MGAVFRLPQLFEQSGIGNGPITGGLFLGSDAAGALTEYEPVCGLSGSAQHLRGRA